jgi:serine/threonine-protein kinase RsbW
MAPAGARSCFGPITKPALLGNLPAFQEALGVCAAESGVEPDRVEKLALAFEEVFVNICNYAYPQGPGDVTLACLIESGAFVAEIIDQGQPFDPASLPDPDLHADLDARPIGGLGWFLVPRLVDDFDVRRADGCNIVRLVLRCCPKEEACGA